MIFLNNIFRKICHFVEVFLWLATCGYVVVIRIRVGQLPLIKNIASMGWKTGLMLQLLFDKKIVTLSGIWVIKPEFCLVVIFTLWDDQSLRGLVYLNRGDVFKYFSRLVPLFCKFRSLWLLGLKRSSNYFAQIWVIWQPISLS